MGQLIIGVVVVSLAIFAMLNVAMSGMDKPKKMIWFAIVVLIPFLGPVIYFIKRPNQVHT